MMRESELESFGAICRRHGLSAEQFQVSVEDYCEFIDGEGVLGREVLVIHLGTSCRRRYSRENVTAWLDAFECDVSRGRFNGHGHEW